MKSKHMQFAAALLVTFLALGGCARIPIEDGLSPEPTVPVGFADDPLTTRGTAPAGLVRDVAEAPASASPELAQVTEARSADLIVIHRTDRADVELTVTDNSRYLVMIRPDDYLGKIAQREYNNPGKWRSIYQWNKELIGANPNVIHPYRELQLFKPEQEIPDWSYEYIIHAVAQGETLWSIAKDWYGDNLAWVIIYADNEELFSSNGGRLTRKMELKIRTSLFGQSSNEQRVSSVAIPDF